MTIPSPFYSNFPLNTSSYGSRVEAQLDAAKNYFAIAFKPGFPLQAQELNEIQEIFYVQKTLDSVLTNAGWTGIAPWAGATPLNKDLIGLTLTGPITFKEGWYKIQGITTAAGLGVWAYNPSDIQITTIHDESIITGTRYGLKVKTQAIECTKSDTPASTEDANLQDSTSYNTVNGPCGAARIKMIINGAGSTAASDEDLAVVFSGPVKTSGANPTRTITFLNGDVKQVDE